MVGIDAMVKGNRATQPTPYTGPGSTAYTEPHVTHEAFIAAVRDLATARLRDEQAHPLRKAKVVYGKGDGGYRGVTYYQAWQNGGKGADDFIEIAATGEESATQLAGTTIHELGHILSRSGHDKVWKEACKSLGLIKAEAAGQAYSPEHFDPTLWAAIAALPTPSDGKPVFGGTMGAFVGFGAPSFKPCPLGIGTRGGKSRGKGSGSRLRLYMCPCMVRVRVASDDFQGTCKRCGSDFVYAGK